MQKISYPLSDILWSAEIPSFLTISQMTVPGELSNMLERNQNLPHGLFSRFQVSDVLVVALLVVSR